MSEPFIDQAPVPVEETPAEPAWTGPSENEWSEVQEELGALREFYAASQQQQESTEPGYPEIDPFDSQQLAAFIQQQVQESIRPVADWTYQQQLSEAEERAIDIIEDDVSRNGEFMLGERAYEGVRALANVYFTDEAAKHGNGPRAAENALHRAASAWREYEKELAQKAVEQHTNQLSSLGTARREPGVGVPGGQIAQGARTVEELIQKYV